MQEPVPGPNQNPGGYRDTARFWEPRRIWYNTVLVLVVLLWLALTWPHLRPALNLVSLGKLMVLGVLANVCYCSSYAADFLLQGLVPQRLWRSFRSGVFVAGMLLALLAENYWIADEIYPDVQPAVANVVRFASNMNFPAPLAVLGFLAACGGVVACVAAMLIFWFARKPKSARVAGITVGALAILYFGLLLGFSAGSRDIELARGQEKYFCEIDCHLAYSIVDVKMKPEADADDYYITLRTRFDETTTSPNRPKGASLLPSPRQVELLDGAGHEYALSSTAGIPLMTPLTPGDSYLTQLEFRLPKHAAGIRLLLSTTPGWPDHLVIGDENSWLHKKTYFTLQPTRDLGAPSNSQRLLDLRSYRRG